jgi:hypothetical protein
MRVRERNLRHDADSVSFGNAMLACEGYAPECSHAGRCLSGGDCFASPPHLVAARMVESLLPTDGRAGLHLAYLRRIVEMLREDRIGL